jgi:hypothetical protein
MTDQDWGESPPLEAFDPAPNQEPHEYVADFLLQWSEDEDGYYQETLRMAAQMLRQMGHELYGS